MSKRIKIISMFVAGFLCVVGLWLAQEVAIANMENKELWKVSDQIDIAMKKTTTDCDPDTVVTVKVTPRLKGLYEDAVVAMGQQIHEKDVSYSVKQNGDKTQVWASGIGKTAKEKAQAKLLGEKYLPGSQYCLAQKK